MPRKYYDEEEGEYIEGEWLDSEPSDFHRGGVDKRSRGRVRSFNQSEPGRTYSFKKKIVLEIDPFRGARIRGPHEVGGRPGMGHSNPTFRFSDTEKRHLLYATVVLIMAFMIFFHGGIYAGLRELFQWPYILYIGVAAFVSVITGFLTHEMGHKFAAQKMGYWAEFRHSKSGLFMALVVSLFGFIIAAPGAVIIHGRLNRKENGITSLSGPAINTAWATLFYGAILISRFYRVAGHDINLSEITYADGLGVGTIVWWTIIYYGFLINTIFGGFNLLPIRFLGLDGYKILDWNIFVYFFFVGIIAFYAFVSLSPLVGAIFVMLCLGFGLFRKIF